MNCLRSENKVTARPRSPAPSAATQAPSAAMAVIEGKGPTPCRQQPRDDRDGCAACARRRRTPPRPVRAREHHTAFHGQYEPRQGATVHVRRQPIARFDEATLDRRDPTGEVRREQRAHRRIGFMQLEGDASDRAAVGAVAAHQQLAIAPQQCEDAVDRIGHPLPGRLQQHRLKAVPIRIKDGEQNVLLAGEYVIEAACVRPSLVQDVRDARRSESFLREQGHGRVDDSLSGARLGSCSTDPTKGRYASRSVADPHRSGARCPGKGRRARSPPEAGRVRTVGRI
jgi:hypothetical protein